MEWQKADLHLTYQSRNNVSKKPFGLSVNFKDADAKGCVLFYIMGVQERPGGIACAGEDSECMRDWERKDHSAHIADPSP